MQGHVASLIALQINSFQFEFCHHSKEPLLFFFSKHNTGLTHYCLDKRVLTIYMHIINYRHYYSTHGQSRTSDVGWRGISACFSLSYFKKKTIQVLMATALNLKAIGVHSSSSKTLSDPKALHHLPQCLVAIFKPQEHFLSFPAWIHLFAEHLSTLFWSP